MSERDETELETALRLLRALLRLPRTDKSYWEATKEAEKFLQEHQEPSK